MPGQNQRLRIRSDNSESAFWPRSRKSLIESGTSSPDSQPKWPADKIAIILNRLIRPASSLNRLTSRRCTYFVCPWNCRCPPCLPMSILGSYKKWKQSSFFVFCPEGSQCCLSCSVPMKRAGAVLCGNTTGKILSEKNYSRLPLLCLFKTRDKI